MSISRTIFMIDDDDEDQELFCDILSSIDPTIECIKPYNGEQAIDLLMGVSGPLPDLIFVDLNMPVMNGFEFLKVVKSSQSLHHIPVIIYTTSSDLNHKKAMKLGASHFLTKPSSIQELKSQLKKLVLNHTLA